MMNLPLSTGEQQDYVTYISLQCSTQGENVLSSPEESEYDIPFYFDENSKYDHPSVIDSGTHAKYNQ